MNREQLIYQILKKKLEGKESHWDDFGITKEEYGSLAEQIRDAYLMDKVAVDRAGIGNKIVLVHLGHALLTDRGHEYIKEYENKVLEK